MANSVETALDLITGRWRSQILHAGVKLGIIDQLQTSPHRASDVAAALSLHTNHTYRLLRALASIGILEESATGDFTLTEVGTLFLADHPNTLRGACLWEEGTAMYSAWKHLPDIIKEGGIGGFKREFGMPLFDKITSDPTVGGLFHEAMTSYSQQETEQVLTALANFDATALTSVCDIGGGHGHLLCHFLRQYPQMSGTVLELAATLNRPELLLAHSLALSHRCQYQAGDMFDAVPKADVYLLKHILHDWQDAECIQILSNACQAANQDGRILIAEYVVPGPDEPDFSKLFDIHMMAILSGRERTEIEWITLLNASGWSHINTWRQSQGSLAVIEGSKQ